MNASQFGLEEHLIRVLHTGGYAMCRLAPPSLEEAASVIFDQWMSKADKSSARFESIKFHFPHGAPFATVSLIVQSFLKKRGCTMVHQVDSPSRIVMVFSDPMEERLLVGIAVEDDRRMSILIA